MVGEHNAMNVLQATAAAWAVGKTRGMTADDLARGLAELPVVAGRLEVVTPTASRRGGRDWRANGEGGGLPLVVVDYAHTDDALGKALAAVRPVADRRGGRLAVVFGCGGDRDRSKRPRMMRAACAGADDVWVTSDNPRTEDPRAIVEEVLTGRVARGGLAVASEVDRAAAIGRAIAAAAAADVVLIAGKGHETYQVVGKVKRHFDDREVAAEALVRWKERA
jgi:murE/murF fusion protein